MSRPVVIMCDARASGLRRDGDAYFIGIERSPADGTIVDWSDEPDRAVVFEDAAAAERFYLDSPLKLFAAVSYVPLSELPQPPTSPSPVPVLRSDVGPAPAAAPEVETEAEFQVRLHRMVVDGTAAEEGRKALARWRGMAAAGSVREATEAGGKAS